MVNTNDVSLSSAIEDSLGVLTATVWKLHEPNDITSWGGKLTTTPRNPISKNRQNRKGLPTDNDSGVGFESDFILDTFLYFIEAFCFATFLGAEVKVPTDVDVDSYTVPSGAVLPAGTLAYGRGFAASANNGVKEVDTGATATDVPVVETLIAETPTVAQNVTLEVCGVRGASGDLVLVVSSGVATLTTTTLDLTTLDLELGQLIHFGGLLVANQFDNGVGYGRLTSISANSATFDKLTSTLASDTGAGKNIDLLFGRFVKNVPVDDGSFLRRTYTFEGDFPGNTEPYEYPKGNVPNTLVMGDPLTDLAKLTIEFVGQDTPDPTATRKTGADVPMLPVQTGAFSTASSFIRLGVFELDETGLTTDFKDFTVTIDNGATGDKVLNYLGNKFINIGNFVVKIEGEIVFNEAAVLAAIRGNRTVTAEYMIYNDDGAISVDFPAATVGDGARSFKANESVKAALTLECFADPTLNTSIGISIFPIVPAPPVD